MFSEMLLMKQPKKLLLTVAASIVASCPGILARVSWGIALLSLVYIHQEPFQAAALEDYCVLELCPCGILTTSG